jgi:hypothetical protein
VYLQSARCPLAFGASTKEEEEQLEARHGRIIKKKNQNRQLQ